MLTELIQLSFDKIMQTRTYTVVVLGARGKRFAIYTEPNVGRILQTHLTGGLNIRPLTHDLMNNVFKGFDIKILQVIINDVHDSIYFARIFLEHYVKDIQHIVEIDSRPSDCIALALMNNIPVYCTRDVFEKTIPIQDEE